jgi:tetratricopeptide (TPR) repeat protein
MPSLTENYFHVHAKAFLSLLVLMLSSFGHFVYGQDADKNDRQQREKDSVQANSDSSLVAWENKQKYFIVVAANKTASSKTDLPFAKVDGTKVNETLRKLGYIEIAALADKRATLNNFVANLKKLKDLPDNSLVIIYYSGHGAVEPQGEELWLQLYGQDKVEWGLGLSLSNLIKTTRNNGYKGELAVIIDACYSGQGALATALTLKDLKDTTVFTSSSEIQESYSINVEKVDVSAFTYFLLKGLTTDWDLVDENRDGFIQYADLQIYIRNQLKKLHNENIIDGIMIPYIASQHSLMLAAYNPIKARNRSTQLAQALTEELRLKTSIKEVAPIFLQNNEPVLPLAPSARARELARQIPPNASLITQAQKAVAEGRYDDARRLFDEATRNKQSDLAEIYQARANAEIYAGRYKDGIDWFEKALQTSPKENPDLLQDFGIALMSMSDFSRAEAVLKRELEIRKSSVNYDDKEAAPSTFTLGSLYFVQGKLDESKLLLQSLQNIKGKIKVDEEEINLIALSRVFLAMIYFFQGERIKAETTLESMLATIEDDSSLGNAIKNWGLLILLDIYEVQGKQAEFDSTWSELKSRWEEAIESRDVSRTSRFLGLLPKGPFSNAQTQEELKRLYTRTLELFRISENVGGSDLFRVLNYLSLIYKLQGKYSEAEPLIKEALQISNKADDMGGASLFLALSNLGDFYERQKKYFEAERIYKQALEVSERSTGQQSIFTIIGLEAIGKLYSAQGKLDAAEVYLKRALDISQKVFSPKSLETTDILGALAAVYRAQKKYMEAERLYIQKIDIYKAALSSNDVKVGESLAELAALRFEQNRNKEAEQLFKQALAICERNGGNISPISFTILIALGKLSEQQDRVVEAEGFYKQALEASEKIYAPNDSNVANLLEALSRLYEGLDEYDKAISYAERALKIRENSPNPDQSLLAINLNRLGSFYSKLNRYSEAEALLIRAVEIWGRIEQPNVFELSDSLMWLAYIYRIQGRFREARNVITKSLERVKTSLGQMHPEVASNLNQLALLYKAEGRYRKSEVLYKQVLEICEKSANVNKFDVIDYLENYASLLRKMKRVRDAVNLETRAKRLREKVNN